MYVKRDLLSSTEWLKTGPLVITKAGGEEMDRLAKELGGAVGDESVEMVAE